MNILITGSKGYIGKILKPMLFADHVIFDYDIGLFEEKLDKEHNIRNYDLIEKTIKDHKIDVLIHLAAIVGPLAGDISPGLTFDINFLATRKIAEICKRNKVKLVFASTTSVYESTGKEMDENSPVSPIGAYAQSKLAAEESILKLADKDFKPLVFRLATLHGWSLRFKADLVVNTFIAKMIEDKRLQVFGGTQIRTFTHVKDISRAIIFGIERNLDGLYNIAFENLSIEELAKIIQIKLGGEIEMIQMHEGIIDKRNYAISSKKFLATGFKPRHNIGDSVNEIADAYNKNLIKTYKLDKYDTAKWMIINHLIEKLREK